MHICFCYVCFSLSVLSHKIDWEERLRNDLICVGWDVKPYLNQSINQAINQSINQSNCSLIFIRLEDKLFEHKTSIGEAMKTFGTEF